MLIKKVFNFLKDFKSNQLITKPNINQILIKKYIFECMGVRAKSVM